MMITSAKDLSLSRRTSVEKYNATQLASTLGKRSYLVIAYG